jgi:hypothetical protein
VQVNSHGGDNGHCTQPNPDGRSGTIPHDKLTIVMTFPCNRNSTRSNNQPHRRPSFIVQPYNAAASSDCRSVLEDVIMGAGVLLDRPGSRVSRTR